MLSLSSVPKNIFVFYTFSQFLICQGLNVRKEFGVGKNVDYSSHENYKLLPPLEKCGTTRINKRQKRVVGGKPVPISKFPWVVQLYLFNVTGVNSSINCGGSFITNDVVLTAAHCITRPGVSYAFPSVALLGNNRLLTPSARMRPVCLPYSSDLLVGWDNTKLKLTGWGVNTLWNVHGHGSRSPSKLLLEGDLKAKERDYCDEFLSHQYGKLEEDRLCMLGDRTGVASCSGDSGSPVVKKLHVPILEGEERTFQFGIVSSGTSSCGYQGKPKTLPNVLYFMPWILDRLDPNFSLDSAESFSAEAGSSLSTEDARKFKKLKTTQYKTDISTGLDIDVASHPNLSKLPNECGSIPLHLKKKTKAIDSEDYDEEIELDYDEEIEAMEKARRNKHKLLKNKSKSKSGQKRRRGKHQERPKRLVGGRIAGFGWYPFMAQIYVRDTTTAEINLRCSGMIITRNVILTAADCVNTIPAPWALDSVRVGNYNRNKTKECIDSECFKAKTVGILKVIVHEDYAKFTHQNNIALLKISELLTYDRVIQPICLATSETFHEQVNATWFISTGWGRVAPDLHIKGDKSAPSNIPKYTEVKLKPREYCERVFSRSFGTIDGSRICGKGDAGSGECDGDGGGPLMKSFVGMVNGKMVRKYMQFGIISIEDCAKDGMPTVYTNVLYYMPWILDNL